MAVFLFKKENSALSEHMCVNNHEIACENAKIIATNPFFFRQCNLLEALKEGEKFRLFFKDPSLNGEFYALSKSPLFHCDRVKFNVFYRKILAVKNDVEKSWKDGLSRAQLMSEEQRLYDRFSEVSFLAWVTWM